MVQRPRAANKRPGRESSLPMRQRDEVSRCCARKFGQVASRLAPTGELIERALAHHRVVCLVKRKKSMPRSSAWEPENTDALHFSGLIAHQQGRSEVADRPYAARAIEREAGRATFFINLGQVFESTGELDKAVLELPRGSFARSRFGTRASQARRYSL